MAVYLSANRERWTYDFWYMGTRYSGYCVDPTGHPVTCKTAAKQAENDIRRVIALTTKHARAHEVNIAQVIRDLRPRWQLTASWDDKKRQIKEIIAFFGATTAIRDISEARIHDYTNFCYSRRRRIWKAGPKKGQKRILTSVNGRSYVSLARRQLSIATCRYCAKCLSMPSKCGTRLPVSP